MRFSYLLFVLLQLACSPRPSKLVFGVTTKEDIISLKGEAVEETVLKDQDIEILTYSDQQKYQLKENRLEAQWRTPTEEEKNLLYWKHKYQNSTDHFEIIHKETKEHAEVTVEYQLKSQGVTLVYQPTIDQVLKVLEYEKIKP